jgi:hypothetical protein
MHVQAQLERRAGEGVVCAGVGGDVDRLQVGQRSGHARQVVIDGRAASQQAFRFVR